MSDNQPAPQDAAADDTAKSGTTGGQDDQQPQTFTQADVDRMIRERIQRERAKFADYDELKAKAQGAQTVEQQLAELKAQNAKIQRDNLAARIAATHGIAPEDADLFLTGTDEETLTAQAKRLAERTSERKKNSNVVPREGNNPTPKSGDDGMREFTRNLFARANTD